MAKAGDQYEFRTGNIWNYANRDDLSTVRRLIKEGVPADLVNKVGWTPLHAAAYGGAERVLLFLLRLKRPHRVARDPVCRAGRTPLMDAARAGHVDAVKLLVAEGALLGEQDNSGRGVLDYAKGTALRSWVEQHILTKARQPAQACPGTSEARAQRATGREKRPERQPCGASSKQKTAQLKAKRAAQREAASRSRGEDMGAAEPVASADDLSCASTLASTLASAVSSVAAPAAAAAHVASAGRLRGNQPLERALGELRCGMAAFVEWWRARPLAASNGRVCLLCLDARRPLLHLPAPTALQLQTSERLVICLTKAELAPPSLLEAASSLLRRKLPRVRVLTFSATGKQLGGGGAASRRRTIHRHLSAAERIRVRQQAEAVAAACGVTLPEEEALMRGAKRPKRAWLAA